MTWKGSICPRFAVGIGVAIALGFLMTLSGRSQSAGTGFTPFTAQGVKQYFGSASGTPLTTSKITVARKRDGSEVEIMTLRSPAGQFGNLVFLTDVSDSAQVTLEPFTMSTVTLHETTQQLSEFLQAEHCPANVTRGTVHAESLGHQIYSVQSSSQFNGVTESEIRWVAPDLGCFTLKKTSRTSSGPWTLKTFTSLTVGDPSPALFQIPANYVERSPSEVAAEWLRIFPGHPWISSSTAEIWDRNYMAHR